MGTINITLGEDTRLNLILGQQLENDVTEVVFDFSAWATAYGSGTLALSVQRPGDIQPYAVVLSVSGTDATWSISSLDTAYKGIGEIQLTYTVGTAVKKSVIYKFTVYQSLGENGEYPSPGQTWQEEMEQEITDVKADLSDNFRINSNYTATLTLGKFVNATNGRIDDGASFALTNPIPILKGQKISLTATGYLTSVGMISTCNSDNSTRTVVVPSIDTTERTYEYVAKEDGYVCCSFGKNAGYKIELTIDYYNYLAVVNTFVPIFKGTANLAIVSVADGYINANNNQFVSSNNFKISANINLYKGQTLNLTAKGYLTTVGMINQYDSVEDKYYVLVPSIDSTVRTYSYTATKDIIIRLGWDKNTTVNAEVVTSETASVKLNNIESYLPVIDTLMPLVVGTEGVNVAVKTTGFINATNNQYSSNNSFQISESIRLFKTQTVQFTATGYLTSIGMINLYDPVNDEYEVVVASIDSTERTYSYTATEDCWIRLGYHKNYPHTAVIVTATAQSARLNNIESDIDELKESGSYPIQYPQMFSNIVCIGDSLTVGASGNGNEILAKNYPHFFEKLSGSDTTIVGHGGYTAKQVWDSYVSNLTNLSSYDCAIIYLGTNGGFTDTVSTDCNASDYTQNADTNTGCYGKIIGKIKADSPSCKIFCVCGPNEYVDRTERNEIIREIAELYSVGLVDIEDCILSDNGSSTSVQRYRYRPIDGIHYNVLGYQTLANMIYDYMSGYMANHLSTYA